MKPSIRISILAGIAVFLLVFIIVKKTFLEDPYGIRKLEEPARSVRIVQTLSPGKLKQVKKYLAHEEAAVRAAAVVQVQKHTTRAEAAAIMAPMIEDKSPRVRAATVQSLASLKYMAYKQKAAFFKALEDEDPLVRERAIFAFGKMFGLHLRYKMGRGTTEESRNATIKELERFWTAREWLMEIGFKNGMEEDGL